MERWTPRNEYISDLHRLKNHLLGQLLEVNMAIQRENNAIDAKRANTATRETIEFLHRAQKPLDLESARIAQANAQSDVEWHPV